MNKQQYFGLVEAKREMAKTLNRITAELAELVFTGSPEQVEKAETELARVHHQYERVAEQINEAKPGIGEETLRAWGNEFKNTMGGER